MRRIDRRRREYRMGVLRIIGVSFAAGALTAAALLWRLDGGEVAAASSISATEAEIAALEAEGRDAAAPPAHAPTPAEGAQRPRQRTPAPVGTSGTTANVPAIKELRARNLDVPVTGVDEDELRDNFTDARGSRTHEAIDIMAPRNTPVRAVENGRIAKLFTSKAGGLTIYMFDPSEKYSYYYAHLERYAAGIKEGQQVKRGEVIGYVGTTGNASPDAPHLHFAIFQLTPERQWWKGEPVNPYLVLR